MAGEKKQIIVPREKAVFWLDKNGVWHNEHGRFEHPKIIKYFHSSIRKDEKGYHVYQIRDNAEEKVYFNYEDTALFGVDLVETEPMSLVLNTGEKITLDPGTLEEKDDNLYVTTPEHRIKLADRVLLKLSRYMTEENGMLVFNFNGEAYTIPRLADSGSGD